MNPIFIGLVMVLVGQLWYVYGRREDNLHVMIDDLVKSLRDHQIKERKHDHD